MLPLLFDIYTLIVLAAVVVSWMQLPPDHPIAAPLRAMTEPLLSPIRQILPDLGGLDLSPLVLLVGLQLLRSALAIG